MKKWWMSSQGTAIYWKALWWNFRVHHFQTNPKLQCRLKNASRAHSRSCLKSEHGCFLSHRATPSHPPFIGGFSSINHPAFGGTPWLWKPSRNCGPVASWPPWSAGANGSTQLSNLRSTKRCFIHRFRSSKMDVVFVSIGSTGWVLMTKSTKCAMAYHVRSCSVMFVRHSQVLRRETRRQDTLHDIFVLWRSFKVGKVVLAATLKSAERSESLLVNPPVSKRRKLAISECAKPCSSCLFIVFQHL